MILDELAETAGQRVLQAKKKLSLTYLRKQAEGTPKRKGSFFYDALNKEHLSFICEVKKASPSKGVIASDFPYMEIAKDYAQAGADAISVLTEPTRFLGDDKYLEEISKSVCVPTLRKDFIIDEYQIYEARLLGASAILLICALLSTDVIRQYLVIAKELGMDVLVETHNEEELSSALDAGARIIGVNNRDLRTFEVDLSVSERLSKLIPDDKIFVAESGIMSIESVERLHRCGADALLIGEMLMRASDKAALMKQMRGTLIVDT